MMNNNFIDTISKGYSPREAAIKLGVAIKDGAAIPGLSVKVPLSTFNRHGLIAGATGTGKTKTLQKIAEQLSLHGVPVLLMDIKGDLSGIAKPGEASEKVKQRAEQTGESYVPQEFPVEFLSLSGEKGARLRATVSEFGPVLFSRILELNDTQAGVVSLVFKYADDNHLPLLDLKDFKKLLQFLTNEGKAEIEKEYGKVASASTGTIMRKLLELEQQGADAFFGERSFDVADLVRQRDGKGVISVLRVTDIQDRPRLFSTFMLCLLAEVYESFPEIGDVEKPKLVIFIDEAHLFFREARQSLLNQVESFIKLIRSKGVGVFFCTQNPADIPGSVLSQLALKVQHALRAFTAADRKAIKQAAENYPLSEYYDLANDLTSLGIGEAFVTALNEKGIPTPLVATLLSPPSSRMNILNDEELSVIVGSSEVAKKYNEIIDSESAYEILSAKLDAASADEPDTGSPQKPLRRKEDKSVVETIAGSTIARQVGRTIAREITRGLLGVLGIRSGRRRKSSWL